MLHHYWAFWELFHPKLSRSHLKHEKATHLHPYYPTHPKSLYEHGLQCLKPCGKDPQRRKSRISVFLPVPSSPTPPMKTHAHMCVYVCDVCVCVCMCVDASLCNWMCVHASDWRIHSKICFSLVFSLYFSFTFHIFNASFFISMYFSIHVMYVCMYVCMYVYWALLKHFQWQWMQGFCMDVSLK